MEKNIILLNKDKSVKVIKNEKKLFKNDCKYLLIPVLCTDNNCFIMIKNKELLDFTYANISVTLCCTMHDGGDEDDTVFFHPMEKKVTSIVDLINFIHSIDRIDYVNYIMNFTSWGTDHEIGIKEFSIKLYKNNNVTFSTSLNDEKTNSNGLMVLLLDLYETVNKNFMMQGENDFLIIQDNRWSLSNKPKTNSIIGLNLVLSQSIYFIESDEYNRLNSLIKETSYIGYVYNIKEIDELVEDVELFESEETNFSEYNYFELTGSVRKVVGTIEFLIYLQYLYNTILLSFNDVAYGFDQFEDEKYVGFDIYLTYTITLSNDTIVESVNQKTVGSSKQNLTNLFNKII